MGFPSLLSSKAPERIIKCGHPSDWDTCSAASRCLDRLQRSFTAAHTHPCIARLILGLTGNVGASFTAVNDNRPLDVTLPSEGGCACVSSAGCRLRWPWSIKMRAAVLWTDRYLNFLSEPLPDVELLRTTEGGAACPVSVLDRDPSSPAFLFFVTIPRPWFGVAWKHHSGEKDNRFRRFKRLNKVHVFNIII